MANRDKDGYTATQRDILDYLENIGPATVQELIRELGRYRESVREAMNELHQQKKVYIKDWPYLGIQRSRLWALKKGYMHVDMPKPPKSTNYEYQRNYRERNKARLAYKRSANATVGNPFAGLMLDLR